MYFHLRGLNNHPNPAQAVAGIPAGVTSLDLCWNGLYQKSGAALAEALSAIPASVTSLDLGQNSLGAKSGAALAEALSAIPASVTSLNLGGNALDRKSGAELAEALRAIPASVTSLDLSWNGLYIKSGAELAEALRVIPASVTLLNLSGNGLYIKSGAELAEALRVIPASVTLLNLSGNGLDRKSTAELAQALSAIPASVTSLDLGQNSLGAKSGAELAEALSAIPASVTLLSLAGNALFAPEPQALSAIPASVTLLDLRGNGLDQKSDEELIEILACLPHSITQVVFDDSGAINTRIARFYQQHLHAFTQLLCDRVGKFRDQTGYSHISDSPDVDIALPCDINSHSLEAMVASLEQKNTPLAFLTCALLVGGFIETAADPALADAEPQRYLEKRLQDSLSFFAKAAADNGCRPICSQFLALMKYGHCDTPSVATRLQAADLSAYSPAQFTDGRQTPASVSLPHLFWRSPVAPLPLKGNTEEPINTLNLNLARR